MPTSMATSMEWTELPPELRNDLRQANIHSIQEIHSKLQERRRANVLSYLQLASLRLCNAQTLHEEFRGKLDHLHNIKENMHLLNRAVKIIDSI